MSENDPDTVDEPESDYTQVSVPDEELPEDLQSGEDNPLAGASDDDAERQDLGDPHMPGLDRDSDDQLSLPDPDDVEDEDGSGES